jgi:hypothetical protein
MKDALLDTLFASGMLAILTLILFPLLNRGAIL